MEVSYLFIIQFDERNKCTLKDTAIEVVIRKIWNFIEKLYWKKLNDH